MTTLLLCPPTKAELKARREHGLPIAVKAYVNGRDVGRLVMTLEEWDGLQSKDVALLTEVSVDER